MYPKIDIGPIAGQTFGLGFGLAFVAAGALVARRLGGAIWFAVGIRRGGQGAERPAIA